MAEFNHYTSFKICNFCGKGEDKVLNMFSAGMYNICDECVCTCYNMIDGPQDMQPHPKYTRNKEQKPFKLLRPAEIKSILDQYVVGQDRAKKSLAVSVYNHYKRIMSMDDGQDVELQKSNVLLLGPTGVGKTFLAQTLAKILEVPFAIADATTVTEAGYVGDDVENVLLRLIQAADFDIEAAERGIIYLDEIDKISRKSENTSLTRDVSGEGVQQSLLKIVEGTVANVPPQGGRKHPNQECIQIDTKNILFICGGAFDGLETHIQKRLQPSGLGFGADVASKKEIRQNIFHKVLPQDLVRFGLVPELVGRLPVITALDELDEAALVKILTEPKNALVKQYEKLLSFDDVKLEVEPEALSAIAEKAIKQNTGARGLRSIMEDLLMDCMYHLPTYSNVGRVKLTRECVTDGAKPILSDRKGEPIAQW